MVEANPSQDKKLRIAIIGASGAVGREIINRAKQEEKIGELILIVRRTLDEWQQAEFTPKLTFIMKESFETFDDIAEQLQGVDAFICTLGTR